MSARRFEVYVIHSPRLTERRAALEPALRALGWNPEWITSPDSAESGWFARIRHRVHPRVTSSELSVYRKHLAALERIGRGPSDLAFILEDDALIPPDFGPLFDRYLDQLPAGCDVAFFGTSSDLLAEPGAGTPLFGIGPRARSMSAVLITRQCARHVLAELRGRPVLQPIDIALDDIIRQAPLSCFWSVPPIVGNGSESGRFPRAITQAAWRQRPWIRKLRRSRLAAWLGTYKVE